MNQTKKSFMLPFILTAAVFAGCAQDGGGGSSSSTDQTSSVTSPVDSGNAPASTRQPASTDTAAPSTGTGGSTTAGGSTSGGSSTGSTSTGGSSSGSSTVSTGKSRGLRLDPSYFYSSNPGQSVTQIATDVITNIKNARGNTVYLYAYNSVHGAFYPTSYSQTTVESGLGSANIFGAVAAEAKKQGLKVVAVVPLNNFNTVWNNNPGWRVKQAGGADYVPLAETYLLSASSAEYRAWYAGFLKDLISHNPNIDQVEAVEPTLDYSWNGVPDQNPSALSNFSAQYPGAAVGSQSWLDFRAKEFLSLVALFNQTVHGAGKLTGLVQTWTVNSSGKLLDATTIKNATGFDWVAIASQSGSSKTDFLVSEFIWQQWFAEYGTSSFNPTWIITAANDYNSVLKGAGATSDLVIHVEISTFAGSYNTTSPTKDQFAQTMANTAKVSNSVSVYDYNQIRTYSAFTELSNW
jgi:hypothetical protein